MRVNRVLAAVAAVMVLASWAVYAQSVTTEAGPVTIDWTDRVMIFTGDGAPDLNAPNAAAARLGAERAARLDALRKALEALKGVQLRAGESVGARLDARPQIRAEVEGVIRNFTVVDTRYYSDGGVQIDVRVPLDGALVRTLLKEEAAPESPAQPEAKPEAKPDPAAPAEAGESKAPTGLVVVAKGFTVVPVLAPKLIDEDGKDVYDVTMVSQAGLEQGAARYMSEAEKAGQHERVKGNPLTVTALRSPNHVDLVLSNKDAGVIRQMAAVSPFLAEGRVVIVKD